MIISVRINKERYAYDIYTLVKAFFPEDTVIWDKDRPSSGSGSILITDVFFRKQEIELALRRQDDVAAPEADCAAHIVCSRPREEKECKSELKRQLYRLLSEYKGEELPWGTLTGIRPVKLMMGLLEQGMAAEEARSYMESFYLCGRKKADLALEIAQRERALLKDISLEDSYSLYVGIPFCPTRCLYCSFPSYPLREWEREVDRYVEALIRELAFISEACAHRRLHCIYIGGGTPTTLSPAQSERLLTAIGCYFPVDGLLEYTVEAGRPDSITEKKLAVLKRHSVDRISINPQSMRQETLDLIGRRHTVAQVEEAFLLARRCGFSHINMDMIAGLPGESLPDMEDSVRRMCALRPDSLTVHSLAVKRGSRLHELQQEYKAYGSVNGGAVMDMLDSHARAAGLSPYYLYRQKNMAGNMENIGYAALDKAGIYNILIMEEKQSILAAGAGAISKYVAPGRKIERTENVKNVAQYMDRLEEMIERKRQALSRLDEHNNENADKGE